MRKEYKSGDMQYKFSEAISEDTIEVNLFNPNVFDYDRDIVIDKDGQLTELDLINQIDDADNYLEGVDVNQLIKDISNDFQEHIELNKLQDSITIEIRDFEYDISNGDKAPHTNFNIVFDDKIYNADLPIYLSDNGDFTINNDLTKTSKLDNLTSLHPTFKELSNEMESKYGEEITRDTLQNVVMEINNCVESDTSLILEEQEQKQEKKQKKSKGFGMSM